MTSSAKWIEGLAPESSVKDAARRSLEPRLTAVMNLLPMAAHLAEHDIEHVHRLRVASRRATAALKLYRDCLPQKRRRSMSKRLRKIRQAAGDARDLDVLANRLEREYGDVVAPVIDLIAADRMAVQPAIREEADRCREQYRFVRKTAKLLEHVDLPDSNVDSSHPRPFQKFAAEQFSKVADKFVNSMPQGSSDPPTLHQFRIRVKDLRYAIELVAPALDDNLRTALYPLIEEVQERLGTVQDHVAAIERCRKWTADAHNEVLRETLNELSEAESRGLADSIQEFLAWWKSDLQSRVLEMIRSPEDAEHHPPVAHQT
jgi:CHAD domain-containing protein